MLRGLGFVELFVLPLTLIFWACVLWAIIVGVRALRNIGEALQRIAVEIERQNQTKMPGL